MATVEYRYGVRSVADGTSYRPANRKGRAGCVCGKCAGVPRCLGRGSSRWELPQEVVAQLRLGHEFKQHLVTIEHEDENAIDAMWRTVPAIAAIASLLDATQEETASLVARARAEHSAGHSTATGRDTATALRAARGRERKLRQDRRDAIEAARPGKTAELTQLAAARKDAITAARRAAAAGGLYWGCADEETEILTSAGWRHHADLDVGDVVLTLNVATRLSEWQPVRAVNRYDARRAPMLTMRSSSHSSVTTLNHRWPLFWTARNGTGRQEWRTSGDLPGQRAILTAAPLADPPSEPKQADALVELVAWFSASGSIDKRAGRGDPRVTIRAASPAQGTRIRWALSRLYGPPAGRRGWDARDPGGTPAWREIPPAAHDQARFRLNRLAAAPLLDAAPGRAVHPGFVRELTAAQLELFVRTAIDASSRRRPAGCGTGIAHGHPELLDAVEFAAILAGYSTCRAAGGLSISRRHATQVASQQRSITPYSGVAWCPTTPNGTWLARRNGTVYYTGNSYGAILTEHDVSVQLVARRRSTGLPARLRNRDYDGTGTISVQVQRESGGPGPEERLRIEQLMEAGLRPGLITARLAEEGYPARPPRTMALIMKAIEAGPGPGERLRIEQLMEAGLRPGLIAARLAEEGYPARSPGTTARITKAIQAGREGLARKPGDPPRSPELLASGAGKWQNVLRLSPWMPPEKFDALPRARRRAIARTGEVVIAVGGGTTVTVPVAMHRMIPADAEVTGASLTITRIAGQWDASVSVTVQVPEPAGPGRAAPPVAVHAGWRHRGDGSVRVATWASTASLQVPAALSDVALPRGDGRYGEIVVPAAWMDRAGYAAGVRGVRDALRAPVQEAVAEWLRRHPQGPGPHSGEVARWRSPGRLYDLARSWRTQPPAGRGGARLAASLEQWRERDRHLWELEAHDRDQLMRRRDDAWRNVAAWLAETAGEIIIDDADLAVLRQRAADDDEDPVMPAGAMRKARARAALSAPGRLRQFVVAAAARRGKPVTKVDAAYLTRTCPHGHVAEPGPSYARSPVIACPACGGKYDQDLSAGALMLERAAAAATRGPGRTRGRAVRPLSCDEKRG